MSKRVLHVSLNGKSARVSTGPKVKSRRKGKGLGTGKLNRQSSQDKPNPAKTKK